MTPPLPRLAAVTIERARVSAWLTRNAGLPLRVILAPSGSGKTTALVAYARLQTVPVLYVHVKHGSDDRTLEDHLRELFNLERYTYTSFYQALINCERAELIIDGIDCISISEEAILERLVYEVPAHISLIYAGTASSIAVHRIEAAGIAATLPRNDLLFTEDETRMLCTALQLEARDQDLAMLEANCNGWAVALADVLRCTIEQGTPLVDAYERWMMQRGRSFAAYVQEEIARFPEAGRALFEKVINGDTMSDQDLTVLEDIGAFVLVSAAGVQPYKVVNDLIELPNRRLVTRSARLSIRMFGRFSIRGGEREVTWIRRRDQQIFRYIAVRPSGRVAKSEIIDVFWPEADPHLAAQSLRTVCSNIRKALAMVIEATMVEHLFVTDGQELCVNLEQAVVDVRRFKRHINEGNEAEDAGHAADAIAHYHAAERLYRADLFSGEPEEAWFLPQREIYREMATLARERITILRLDVDEAESVTEEVTASALENTR